MIRFTPFKCYLNCYLFTSFKVFFVNPLDLKSIELLSVANELLQNSFPVRSGTLIFLFLSKELTKGLWRFGGLSQFLGPVFAGTFTFIWRFIAKK